ncbi:two-component system, response regulator PdtaR [Gammaproteobacteria bacterium]
MTAARIMIVEDEIITAMDIGQTLKTLGYHVVATVSTGEKAVDNARDKKPDLILMDISLAGEMDGIEAAKCIHLSSDIPVIYLTAYADDKTLERAKITQPFGYLIKPFNEKELHSNIEIVLYKSIIEKQLKESRQRLYENLKGVIKAINELIIRHDHYMMRGHHRKVTKLSCAIARQMGLPQDQIEGIEMGSQIHGMGLLDIPFHMVISQKTLSDFHLNAYQQYPRIGYNALKDIDFSWPIAQMVLQHRELLDGSGFPDGAEGDEIILESRIIGLAYVVVEMLYHFFDDDIVPKTINDVLEHISKERGKLYDPAVVNACTTLFRENKFTFF